jgi:hypothetical protein
MSNLKDNLTKLEQILISKNAEVIKYLKSGLADSDINNFLKEYRLKPDLYNDLTTLYSWHGGTTLTKIPTGNFYLFPTFYLLSIDEIKDVINYQNSFYTFKEKNLLPILSSGDDYICLSVQPDGKPPLLYYSSISNVDIDEVHTPIFDTVDKMIETIINCFQNSVFEKRGLYIEIINLQLYKEIATTNNPLSLYWKSLNW